MRDCLAGLASFVLTVGVASGAMADQCGLRGCCNPGQTYHDWVNPTIVGFLCTTDDSPPRQREYGAISISPRTLSWGTAWGYGSRDAAQNAALGECRAGDRQATDCAVDLWFYDACGSLALKPDSGAHDGVWASEWANSRAAAQSQALKTCQKGLPAHSCKVVTTICAGR